MLIPLDREEKEYVVEFLGEVMLENYLLEDSLPGRKEFVFSSERIRAKYPFLPVRVNINKAY